MVVFLLEGVGKSEAPFFDRRRGLVVVWRNGGWTGRSIRDSTKMKNFTIKNKESMLDSSLSNENGSF